MHTEYICVKCDIKICAKIELNQCPFCQSTLRSSIAPVYEDHSTEEEINALMDIGTSATVTATRENDFKLITIPRSATLPK